MDINYPVDRPLISLRVVRVHLDFDLRSAEGRGHDLHPDPFGKEQLEVVLVRAHEANKSSEVVLLEEGLEFFHGLNKIRVILFVSLSLVFQDSLSPLF